MRVSEFIACALLSLGIAACDSSTTEVTDVSALEDSALALDVLSAKGDSNYFGPVDDRVYEEARVAASQKKATRPTKLVVKPVVKPVPVAPAPPRPVLADVSVPLSEMRRVKAEEVKPREEVTPRKTGIIASGAALSLV